MAYGLDRDYLTSTAKVWITESELASLRKYLYDARLALAAGSSKQAASELVQALDLTQEWTVRT